MGRGALRQTASWVPAGGANMLILVRVPILSLNWCLLNQDCCFLTRCIPLAFFIGCPLARRDLVDGSPLCFHRDMRVPGQHGEGDVASNAHDHLVAGNRFDMVNMWRLSCHGPVFGQCIYAWVPSRMVLDG